jgi:HEPN domain-containing protein
MNPLTREWLEKAEGDWDTAGRELRARKRPNYDAACFHAQQCAEKCLKALLQEAGVAFARTHDLAALLDLLMPLDPSWDLLRAVVVELGVFAVYVRYPGYKADRETARRAVSLARPILAKTRHALGA